MAPKAKKSSAMKKRSGNKKGVSIEMVKQAITALGDRNGSSIKAIFNWLVSNKKVSASSRTLVILAIGRGVRDGTIAKKTPKTFVVRVGGAKRKASPKKRSKRSRKSSAKKTSKRRGQKKRKSLKKKRKSTKRKSAKKSKRSAKKTQRKQKAKRSRKTKKTARPQPAMTKSRRPLRKAARGKSYRQYY